MVLSEDTTVVFKAQIVAFPEARPNVPGTLSFHILFETHDTHTTCSSCSTRVNLRVDVALVIIVMATEVTLEACISIYEVVVMGVVKARAIVIVDRLL